jgi:hypothetical protein
MDMFSNIDVEKAAADVSNTLKEAAYVAVGLGVLGFQRAQVQRVELMKQIEAQLTEWRSQLSRLSADSLTSELPDGAAVRGQLTDLARSVDEALAPFRQQFEDQLDRLEEVLPPNARDLVQTVRGAAATQEHAIRSAVGLS